MKRVECLDGLRGIAALWVLVGHAMVLTGLELPIVGQGKADLGVDLFILLSGFLMVFQYQLRCGFENWSAPATWLTFWTRRFFRIAPLFYVMLAVALLLGPAIYTDRTTIDVFLGKPLQQPERYLDSGLTNIAMHLTFAFGLFPQYAFRSPLPDWSLGLEMQFYAVFPFIVMLARKIGWIAGAILAAVAGVAAVWVMGQAGVGFPMPAFLPLKLHLFLCGMLIAADHRDNVRRLRAQIGLAALLAALPIGGVHDLSHTIMRELLILAFAALVHWRSLGLIDALSRLLGGKVFHWLGELSYGVYLCHLLVMQPAAAWIITRFGGNISEAARFMLVFAMTAPAAYLIAYITYRLIEAPGQRLGKKLLERLTANESGSRQIPAEQIAAP